MDWHPRVFCDSSSEPMVLGNRSQSTKDPLAVDVLGVQDLGSPSKGWNLTAKLWSLRGLGLEQGETIAFEW